MMGYQSYLRFLSSKELDSSTFSGAARLPMAATTKMTTVTANFIVLVRWEFRVIGSVVNVSVGVDGEIPYALLSLGVKPWEP